MLRRTERAVYNAYRAALRRRGNPVPELVGAAIPAEAVRKPLSPRRRKVAAAVVAVVLVGAGWQLEAYRDEFQIEAELNDARAETDAAYARSVEAHRALAVAEDEGAPPDLIERLEERGAVLEAEMDTASKEAERLNSQDWENWTLGRLW